MRYQPALLLVMLMAAMGLAACRRTAAPTPAATPTETPLATGLQIVFHSDPNIGSDFYLMNPDGTALVRLTEDFNTEAFGKVSPDGRWLAFASRGGGDLFLLDLEAAQQGSGAAPLNLTRSATSEAEPSWSPDSRRIAYGSYDTHHIGWLEIDPADGAVAATFDPQAPGAEPAWSPDGARLTFFSDRDGNAEIYVMNADGTGQTRLTDEPAADYSPRWSPDGQHLLFISERDGQAEVYVMNADGTQPLNVSADPAHDEFASWSPDSRRIVYVSYQGGADPHTIGAGNAEIFVVKADGTGRTNLTANAVWDGDPAWSPDGAWIVFTQRVGPQHQGHIHVMPADGGASTRLAGEPGDWNDCCAAWRP